MRKKFVITVLLVLSLSACAGATGISLYDAIDLALSNHPNMIKARAAIEEMSAASGQLESSMGWRVDSNIDGTAQKTSPMIKLMYEVSDQDIPECYSMYTASLILSKGIFWSPENKAQRGQVQAGVESAMEQYRMTKNNLMADVVASYYNILKAADGVGLASTARDDAKLALKIAQDKLADGSGTERQVISARSMLLQTESNLQISQQSLELSLKYLANLIGSKSLRLEDLTPPSIDIKEFPVRPSPWSWRVDDMAKLAIAHRPEMRLTELGVFVASKDVDIARAASRPNVNLSSSYTWGENGVRLSTNLASDGRWSTIASKWDDSLPELEGVEISEEDWERWEEIWDKQWEGDPPSWSPTKEEMENILSRGAAAATPSDEWDIKLGVTFNIFDSQLINKGIERAKKKVEQANSESQLTAQMIELDVFQRYNELLEKYNKVKITEMQLIEVQKQQSEAMEIKKLGLLTHQEEQGLNTLLLQKDMELKWALYDYEVAKVKLGVAIGMEPEWLMGILNL